MEYTFLTQVHTCILEALARYKFLTTGQLLWLGIMTDRANLNREIKKLRDRKKPLLATISFGVDPRVGKLENFHTLTLHGVAYLREQLQLPLDEIKHLKGTSSVFHRDYFHRLSMINFMISLDLWSMDQMKEITFFDSYFDTTGNANRDKNLVSKTRIDIPEHKSLYADGICMLHSPGQQALYAVEMYRGKDTARVLQQLRLYAHALASGAINEKYDHGQAVRVLLIFDQQSNMESVLEQLATDPFFEHVRPYFLLKAYQDILDRAPPRPATASCR